MKYQGRTLKPNEQVLVLPRADGDIVFTIRALTSTKEFEDKVKEPVAPKGRDKTGEVVEDFEDTTYKAEVKTRGDLRWDYMMVQALRHTDGLEWEKVKLDDPYTYSKWEEEFQEAGFTEWEIGRIKATVMEVNGLNEAKIAAATASFLAKLAVQLVP